MAENCNCNSNEEKKDFNQELKNKVENVKNEVSEKIEDFKNSEFAGKVSEVAGNVRDKAKDMIEDIKESQFADKVGDVAGNVRDKAKDMIEDIKESQFADKVGDAAVKAKGMGGRLLEKLGTLAKLPVLINAGKKLQESAEDTTEKENLLNDLDTKVAAIIEDGVITPEEEATLVQEAKAIGIDVDEFLAEVRGRLQEKK